MNYTPFLSVIKQLNIQKGDILLISSDITRLFMLLIEHESITDPNFIINILQEAIGCEGTLLFPTYNWDFCRGTEFNYYKTQSKTGSLSKTALKRKDFIRTKHPIYSFAVWGEHQEYLYSLNNTESFGHDSPFNFLYENHGKNLLIDVDYQNSFTFLHYVEKSISVVYRYEKNFSAVYTNELSFSSEKIYSMYVRSLELETENNINPIGKIFEENGIAERKTINDIPFIVLDLYSTFDIVKNDIQNNSAKNIVIYKGQ